MQKKSPEDRLLNLIKGKQKDQNGQSSLSNHTVNFETNAAASEFSKSILLKIRFIKISSLVSLNRILSAILVLVFAYLVYSLVFSVKYKDINVSVALNGDTNGNKNENDVQIGKADDYSYYSKEIDGKNLFQPTQATPERPKGPAVDVAKKFSLVGILPGAELEAIIEDKETEKTLYLKKGESISGVTVDEIGDGKVVLDFEGAKTTLVL